MKIGFWLSLIASALLIVGCSSVKTPKAKFASHDNDHDIPSIDRMIVELKKDYIKNCYMPVAKREPPEKKCQTELFQMLERRYHSNYQQMHVDMAANDLFFKDVDDRIRNMTRSDPETREALRNGAFRSIDEMIQYYREAYKFETK